MKIIDSHQHFWHYNPLRDGWMTDDMAVIRRDFLPQDLKPLLDRAGVTGGIAVQADQSDAETQFLLQLADENPFIVGVVGWIDLRSPDLPNKLEALTSNRKLRGFRHIIQGDPDYLHDIAFIDGVRELSKFGYAYDLLIYDHQITAAVNFLHAVGDGVRIVIDHLAKPSIARNGFQEWSKGLQLLAACDHVSCKLSGMVTEATWNGWSESTLQPYIDHAFETFGAERLMYGSDWPVCLLSSSYPSQLEVVTNYISKLSADEKAMVMGENALTFYNL